MRTKLHLGVELALFLTGACVPFVWLGQVAARAGGLEKAAWIAPVAMLLPMTSAVIVQKLVARKPVFGADGLGFRWGRARWWLLAPAGFALFMAITMLVSFALTPELLASPVTIAGNLARNTQFLPRDLRANAQIAIAFAITLIAGPLINLPIFLGEEVGWRGFMNPRLMALFGKPGLLVGGAVWALWHLPIILLGHNYPQHTWKGLAVWIPICICLNILLQAVREAGRSIFPCALAHGTINQLAGLSFAIFVVEPRMNDLVHGPAGLIGLAVLAIPAWWVYRRRPQTGEISPQLP